MDEMREIPAELQPLYDSLHGEVVWIHARWKVYLQVFNADLSNADILNRSAPFFFSVVQRTIIETTMLGLSRLTDPPQQGRYTNRSLRQVIVPIRELGHDDLANTLDQLAAVVESKCRNIRIWRDKLLAHSDLPSVLQVAQDPVPDIPQSEIEAALLSVREFMNRINEHFTGAHTGYEHFWTVTGGDQLLAILKLGLDNSPWQNP